MVAAFLRRTKGRVWGTESRAGCGEERRGEEKNGNEREEWVDFDPGATSLIPTSDSLPVGFASFQKCGQAFLAFGADAQAR